MKKLVVTLAMVLGIQAPVWSFSQGTAFTYQGRLTDGSSAANGTYDLRFILYDSSAGGSQQGPILTESGTSVSNGLFTVTLDFGNEFPGAGRWMEIAVRTNGAVSFTTISPRQPVTPAPYAITAGNVVSGGIPAGTYVNAVTFNNSGNNFGGTFTGNGGGLTNLNAATLNGLSSSNFWKTTGNSNTTAGVNYVGTADNQPLELRVKGARALRLEPNTNGAPNVIAGSPINYVSNGVVGATISGGGAILYNNYVVSNTVAANFGTVGGGSLNTAGGTNASVGGGFGNFAIDVYATVGGGAGNQAVGGLVLGASTVAGGYANHAGSDAATVGGGYANLASGKGSVVAGGGYDGTTGFGNLASSNAATVGGGLGNQAVNIYATVAGGQYNIAGGQNASVGGGGQNVAGGPNSTLSGGLLNSAGGADSVVSGGYGCHADGSDSFVGGGYGNYATGYYGTVPGGLENKASGDYSFAAGSLAQAVHQGAFVWADSQAPIYSSDRNDQFKVRAGGGVLFDVSGSSGLNPAALRVNSTSSTGVGIFVGQTSSDATAVFTASGTGPIIKGFSGSDGNSLVFQVVNSGDVYGHSFNPSSDRNLKENFSAVSAGEILDRVLSLPVTRWNFKTEPDKEHIGPMAQDFHETFGLNGTDDKHISLTDEGGVALAAIQGLNHKLEDRSEQLEKRTRQLEAENSELKQTVAELKSMVEGINGKLERVGK